MVSGPKSSKNFTILSLEPRETVDRVDAFSSTMTGTSEFSGLALPVSKSSFGECSSLGGRDGNSSSLSSLAR
jgi:hypothetical protein